MPQRRLMFIRRFKLSSFLTFTVFYATTLFHLFRPSGMSSTDPTHLWRSPWFRSRVPLPLYRSMLTSTEVPCVSYADLIDPLSDATSSSNPVGLSGASLGVLPPQSSPSFKRPKKALVGGHRVREKAAKDHADAIGATNILAHLKVVYMGHRRGCGSGKHMLLMMLRTSVDLDWSCVHLRMASLCS